MINFRIYGSECQIAQKYSNSTKFVNAVTNKINLFGLNRALAVSDYHYSSKIYQNTNLHHTGHSYFCRLLNRRTLF